MNGGRRFDLSVGCWCSGILNMTRKRKIRIAVTAIVLGVVACAFLPGEKEALKVTFAGVSVNDSNLVYFTITNSSRTVFLYEKFAIDVPFDDSALYWAPRSMTGASRIMGRGATNRMTMIRSTNRWTFVIEYRRELPDTVVNRNRRALREYAKNHGWQRIAEWVLPEEEKEFVYGPEMVGNKPAPPEKR